MDEYANGRRYSTRQERRMMRKRRQRKIRAMVAISALLVVACVFLATRFLSGQEGGGLNQPDTLGQGEQQGAVVPAPSPSAAPTETPAPSPSPTPQVEYPALTSKSGTYTRYGNSNEIRVDNQVFELCGYNEATASSYAQLVSKTADALQGQTKVYSLVIPTASGVTLPDDIRPQLSSYIDQGETIQTIFSKMSGNVIPVSCYDNLMQHRDEYLYFRTDHHWNGPGAYYAYESFCKTKGVTPYTMDQREEVSFDGFLGTLYTGNNKDPQLLPGDTVLAYKPYCQSATMTFYAKDGTATQWPIISDVSGWATASKYSTFAGGDNPLTVFQNPEVTDSSVCVVVKESFGNALLPYLVDHYSTVYEVDYRYWSGNLIDFAKEKGADDLIFANNIMMVSTGLLVGSLSNIINS